MLEYNHKKNKNRKNNKNTYTDIIYPEYIRDFIHNKLIITPINRLKGNNIQNKTQIKRERSKNKETIPKLYHKRKNNVKQKTIYLNIKISRNLRIIIKITDNSYSTTKQVKIT